VTIRLILNRLRQTYLILPFRTVLIKYSGTSEAGFDFNTSPGVIQSLKNLDPLFVNFSQPDESESKTEFSGNRKEVQLLRQPFQPILQMYQNFKSYSGSLSIILKMDLNIVNIGAFAVLIIVYITVRKLLKNLQILPGTSEILPIMKKK
jgi:hypothetical protein